MPASPTLERFARVFGISIHQARRLRTLVNKAADAQVEEHNEDKPGVSEAASAACDAVDKYAAKLGLSTNWSPGLYPLFQASGKRAALSAVWEHLPD